MSDFTLFIELREEFKAQLAGKTGWGRNEVLEAFDRSAVRVVRGRRKPPPTTTTYPIGDPQYPEYLASLDTEYPDR